MPTFNDRPLRRSRSGQMPQGPSLTGDKPVQRAREDALRILILEDEFLIAQQLAYDIRRMGDIVVGPFASVEDAMQTTQPTDAAILDVRIGREMSFALATQLKALGIPFVFYSAFEHEDLPAELRDESLYVKPSPTATLVEDLRRRSMPAEPDRSLLDVMVVLRQKAQLLIRDPYAADRLLEAVLIEATANVESKPTLAELEGWLLELMWVEYRRNGRRYMI